MRKIFTLISVLALGAMGLKAEVTVTPVKIKSGFNLDVICEDKEHIGSNTSFSDVKDFDGIDGGGAVYYTTGVQEEGALCGADGIFYSKMHGVKYQINPVGNNGLVLKAGKTEGGLSEGTLEFETPMKGKSIYVVATSADGDTQLDVTVNYKDGTTDNQTITVYNWDTSSYANQAAVAGLGRLFPKETWAGPAGTIQGGYSFNLYESAINTDPDKEIASVKCEKIDLPDPSNPEKIKFTCCCVFAVSISSETVEDTGVNGVTADDAVAVEYYNINGQRLEAPAQGVNIVKYSDGTVRKEVVR